MKMVSQSFRFMIFLKVTILSDKRNCVLILVFRITVFKKLSETLRIIVLPILLIVSNWFWLNFYTMKFSRFICRISDSLFILPHPGNIVKRFFQLFLKFLFRLTAAAGLSPAVCDSFVILPRSRTPVKGVFHLFSSFYCFYFYACWSKPPDTPCISLYII